MLRSVLIGLFVAQFSRVIGHEFDCLSSARCNLYRGDLAREFGQGWEHHYAEADLQLQKYLKFKECGAEEINANCKWKESSCEAFLIQEAQMLMPSIASSLAKWKCSYFSWKTAVFLCKNTAFWPKNITDALDPSWMTCGGWCPTQLQFFEAYHLANGKTNADFPPDWNRLKSEAHLYKTTVERDVHLKNRTMQRNNELRQFDSWNLLVGFVQSTNAVEDAMEIEDSICRNNYWADGIVDNLPTNLGLICKSHRGPESDIITLQLPGTNALTGVSQECSSESEYNGLLNPLLLGVGVAIQNQVVVTGRRMCAGTSIRHNYTNSQYNHIPEELVVCPIFTAVCSIGGTIKNGQIANVRLGCCAEPLDLTATTITIGALPEPTQLDSWDVPIEYEPTYRFSGARLWLCSYAQFVGDFRTDNITFAQEQGGKDTLGTRRSALTQLYCSSPLSDRGPRRVELKEMADYFRLVKSSAEHVLNGTDKGCSGEFASTVILRKDSFVANFTNGSVYFRKSITSSTCRNSIINANTSARIQYRPAGADGNYSLKFDPPYDLIDTLNRPPRTFNCPLGSVICGVMVRSRRTQNIINYEELYYQYICCKLEFKICLDPALTLEPLPSLCTPMTAPNMTSCIVTYTYGTGMKLDLTPAENSGRVFDAVFNKAHSTPPTWLGTRHYFFKNVNSNDTHNQLVTTSRTFTFQGQRLFNVTQPTITCGGYRITSPDIQPRTSVELISSICTRAEFKLEPVRPDCKPENGLISCDVRVEYGVATSTNATIRDQLNLETIQHAGFVFDYIVSLYEHRIVEAGRLYKIPYNFTNTYSVTNKIPIATTKNFKGRENIRAWQATVGCGPYWIGSPDIQTFTEMCAMQDFWHVLTFGDPRGPGFPMLPYLPINTGVNTVSGFWGFGHGMVSIDTDAIVTQFYLELTQTAKYSLPPFKANYSSVPLDDFALFGSSRSRFGNIEQPPQTKTIVTRLHVYCDGLGERVSYAVPIYKVEYDPPHPNIKQPIFTIRG